MRLSALPTASPEQALLGCGIPADQVEGLLASAGGCAWSALRTYAALTKRGPALIFVGSNVCPSLLTHQHLGRRCLQDPEQFEFCLHAFLFGGKSPVETLYHEQRLLDVEGQGASFVLHLLRAANGNGWTTVSLSAPAPGPAAPSSLGGGGGRSGGAPLALSAPAPGWATTY